MYKFTQVEDQTKFCLPLNRDTEYLYYNTFLVIDANVLTEPRVWEISKINRTNSKGVAVYTCKQVLANQHTLKADYDEDGNVVAWWADWKENAIVPTPIIDEGDQPSFITSTITCSGKCQVKIGGSAKTFTVNYYDSNGDLLPEYTPGTWSFKIDDEYVPNTLMTTTMSDDNRKVKFKFLGDDSYIGKILHITNTSNAAIATLDVEIIPL